MGLTRKTTLTIENRQRKPCDSSADGENPNEICQAVEMGTPEFRAAQIPVVSLGNMCWSINYRVRGKLYDDLPSMGNPHAVIPVEDGKISIAKTGSAFEHLPASGPVNTEFIQILDQHNKMRVWERGSGERLSCGTGACAAAVAAMLSGCFGGRNCRRTRGGRLFVTWDRTKIRSF